MQLQQVWKFYSIAHAPDFIWAHPFPDFPNQFVHIIYNCL
jgi:hypothetical protein